MSGPAAKPARTLGCIQRNILIVWLVLTCVSLLCLVTLATTWYIWNDVEEDNIRRSEPAGRVLAVAQSAGLFTRTVVETDLGFFSLTDGASLAKGEGLSLQTRGNGARFLCDGHQRCMRLNESYDRHWPKPVAAAAPEQTPQPAGARP